MIYLDNGATSFRKPDRVRRAVAEAMARCANPGRGGYGAAMAAAETVFRCREAAAEFFECEAEQVAFTSNCTHGLNIAIRTLVKPGGRVVVSGFEHNAVTRPLHGLGAELMVAGRKLFDWEDTLEEFDRALRQGADAAVFTHVSNVFGYILPVAEMAALCRERGVPFIIDAAQSAGTLPVSLKALGADFIAMPGHKGLLGPQGTGILLCGRMPEPLLLGGTGSDSINQRMPDFLPDRVEAGTVNVPGIGGLHAGIAYLRSVGMDGIHRREALQARRCGEGLERLGMRVFRGDHQSGTVSFVPGGDCEEAAAALARQGIAVRAGLHCAPLAHESAGTLETGTVRVSFGPDASPEQTRAFLRAAAKLPAMES
ncbi:MAG: aminotransferase class V-fold PLP-dependent enzyme [Oscillospiraceae bacterium]|nr:aminotransferase class V-fold PLP-dependent enzyme [Oscillospiraceae bacterium]